MAIESVDLWGHIRAEAPADDGFANVRMIPVDAQTVHVPVEEDWHSPALQDRADKLLAAWDAAVAGGHPRRTARLRRAWLHQVHLDRVAYAREVARERSLRLDPIGRGPVVDRPTVHFRDRLPWYLTPVGRYADERLPERAAAVLDTWNGSGGVFDGLCIADQPVSSGHFPVHSLVATISANGRTGDWFVLDRWAS